MKILRKRNWLVLMLAVAVLIVMAAVWSNRELEHCPICEGLRCHAPCLVNLHTGEVGELVLYEPHPFKVGELAEEQRGGYFCFMTATGLRGTKTADPWVIDMDIPTDGKPMRKNLFCGECRKLLADVSDDGYALVDLYDRLAPVVLPIRDGAEYTLRCYTIAVTSGENGSGYHLTVSGNLEN